MIDLSIATNPFLDEKQRAYWGKIERRLQRRYGPISLPEFLEKEKLKGKTLINIAAGLGIESYNISNLLKQIGPLFIKRKSKKEIKKSKQKFIELKDLSDIVKLDIFSLDDLNFQQRKKWMYIERELREQGKAPSLPAYLLYEHHFKYRTLRDLGSELGKSHQGVSDIMKRLGIPSRTEVFY